ncbi:MAG TPA: DUF5671 domain-containing protein [Candidatus Paceibacterota bacterium]
MNPQKSNAKDVFLNLGATVALSVFVGYLVSLLFTIINKAYPAINSYYYGSYSISFPVATLIIVFPIYILLMWLLEKSYAVAPEDRNAGIRKWLTYITLFVSGICLAGDLVYVVYYFIDGQEMTAGFLMKALSVLVISLGIFFYYISDVRGKLNGASRKVWTLVATLVILGSIVWGFSVLGSPRTQQLYKYDQEKVSQLQSISSEVSYYWQRNNKVPMKLSDLSESSYYTVPNDKQSGAPYEYIKSTNTTYQLCAEFNKSSEEANTIRYETYPSKVGTWNHPAGRYCFSLSADANLSPKSVPIPLE